ncbi:MAG: ATP-binding protein [Anaerovoracaceae bacterium]
MSEVLKMTIPGDPEYIKIAKMAVGAAASLCGFNFECVEDIRMAVGEACKCITCHGHDGWSESYNLTCHMEGESMSILVEDSLSGTRVAKGKRPCLDCPNEGNLSVQIIRSLMTEVELINAGEGCKSIKMGKSKC